MIEEWNIEDSTVLGDKVVQVDPFVLVNKLINYLDLRVACSRTDSSLSLAHIWEDVHCLGIELFLRVKMGTHQITVDLQL